MWDLFRASAVPEEAFPATAFSDSDGFGQKNCCCSTDRNEFAIPLKARILAIWENCLIIETKESVHTRMVGALTTNKCIIAIQIRNFRKRRERCAVGTAV